MSLIVGIGGTTRAGSGTECALRVACNAAAREGDEVRLFDGAYMSSLPFYGGPGWTPNSGRQMVDAIRESHALVISSPGYHGSISGLLKNALDYIEDLAKDERVYLHNRPVGLIVTAFGHQAATSAMITLRTIVHALRGWPTPFGAALKVTSTSFDKAGKCTDPAIAESLSIIGEQLRYVLSHRDVPDRIDLGSP